MSITTNSVMPVSGKRVYSVAEAAKVAGITAALLRKWEERYHWPQPKYDPTNGYRIFFENQVRELVRVAELVRAGHSIGTLIVDGMPRLPERGVVSPEQEIAELRSHVAELVSCLMAPPSAYLSDAGRIQRQATLERIRDARVARSSGGGGLTPAPLPQRGGRKVGAE